MTERLNLQRDGSNAKPYDQVLQGGEAWTMWKPWLDQLEEDGFMYRNPRGTVENALTPAETEHVRQRINHAPRINLRARWAGKRG